MATLITDFTTAVTSVQTDVMSILGVIVPIAIAIVGAIFVIRKGISWFKSLSRG